jgi:hypothetical protein
MSDILGSIDAALEGMPGPAPVTWTRDKATGEYSAEVDGYAVGITRHGNRFTWTVLDLSADGEAGKLAEAKAEAEKSVRDYLATVETSPADEADAGDLADNGPVVEDLPFADPTLTDVPGADPSDPRNDAEVNAVVADEVSTLTDRERALMTQIAEMQATLAAMQAQQTPAAFANPAAVGTRAAIIDDAMSTRGADGVGIHPETNPAASTVAEVESFFPPAFAAEVPVGTYDAFAGETDPVKARRDRARKLGREVAREVRELFETYIVFPDELADAYAGTLALWCLHTHVYYYQRVTPYMLLTSPTAGAGKSTVERIAGRVSAHSIELVAPSVAAVRMLASDGHTLILDEVDELYQGKDFKSILNAGYKHGATVPRVKGKTVMMDKVFSPKMLAGIAREGNPVEGALLDRCIQIDLQRAAQGEVPFFDPQAVSEALREKITEWARLIVGDLERFPGNMPALDSPRAIELWNPLVSVADVIGADWGTDARTWAEEITGRREVQADPNIQILADTRDVLLEWITANPQATHIETAVLCELRNRHAGRTFVDALTGINYGRRLGRFGVKSASIDKVRQYRVSDGNGQLHETLALLFARYCD